MRTISKIIILLGLLTAVAYAGAHKPKQKYAGWYMRTKVTATNTDGNVYRHHSAGVFGELKQSKKGLDRHDIPSYGPALLQVVFPQYNWDENSGDYYSDYRNYEKSGAGKGAVWIGDPEDIVKSGKRAVWTFQVKNQHTVNLADASIKIELDGMQQVDFVKKNGNVTYIETTLSPEKRDELTLVDVDNQKTYSIDELEDADLSMDGSHTRTFRWVRGRVENEDFKPVVKPE